MNNELGTRGVIYLKKRQSFCPCIEQGCTLADLQFFRCYNIRCTLKLQVLAVGESDRRIPCRSKARFSSVRKSFRLEHYPDSFLFWTCSDGFRSLLRMPGNGAFGIASPDQNAEWPRVDAFRGWRQVIGAFVLSEHNLRFLKCHKIRSLWYESRSPVTDTACRAGL